MPNDKRWLSRIIFWKQKTLNSWGNHKMKRNFKLSTFLFYGVGLTFAALLPVACHDAKADQDSVAITCHTHRPDKQLHHLMKSIADGNASEFAHICVYPIQRPYPLPDIQDSAAMVEYFPVIMDDSIRNVMRHASISDWEDFGWRGWSMRNSQPIWYDDGVQFVDYISPAERHLHKMLAKKEMTTLHESLQGEWRPVMSLREAPDGYTFRIDRDGETYRLAGYTKDADLKGAPQILIYGNLTQEGTAESRTYSFAGKDGAKAIYSPDADDADSFTLTLPGKSPIQIQVEPTYWLDLI